MKGLFYLLVLVFLAGSGVILFGGEENSQDSQFHIVTGMVCDIHHQPLEGVTVSLKGQDRISFTSTRGNFVLKIPVDLKTASLKFDHNCFHPYTLRIRPGKINKSLAIVLIPKEYIREEISVTALNREERTVDVPAAESVVSELEIKEKIPENIVSTLLNTPGIHFIGSGGFSITPSIRGIARRRVLILVDGMRVTGDRRAGVSATFMAPELIEKIEMVRSASSVFYGSDAMGGVIQLLTQSLSIEKSKKNMLNLSLGSGGGRLNSGFLIQQKIYGFNLSTGFQLTRADNYSTPNEEIYHSGYNSYSGLFTIRSGNEKREFTLSYVGGYGTDLGKPNRDNDPDSFTKVSEEGEHFFRFHYTEKTITPKGSLEILLYLNPSLYSLEKYQAPSLSYEYTHSQGYNLGGKAFLNQYLNKDLSFQTGVEWFGRRGFDFKNTIKNPEITETSYPLSEGKRDDTSLFFTADYKGIPGIDIMGGIRYTWFSLHALVENIEKEKQSSAPSFFLGMTKKFGKSVSLFVNVGRAFRLPGLSESFYTGLTGRKYVIGNPDLIPESSFNIDSGIKIFSNTLYLGAYVFAYRIDDMIERYKNDEGIYTYDNISRGDIYGGEIEFQLFPLKNLEFFGHYFYYRGRSSEMDESLNDIPSPKLLLGGKLLVDRFWAEINFLHSFEKTDPGPAEVENHAYSVVTVKAGYYFSTHFYLNLKIANFLNELYYPNPDPDIPPARGVDISLGIHYYF